MVPRREFWARVGGGGGQGWEGGKGWRGRGCVGEGLRGRAGGGVGWMERERGEQNSPVTFRALGRKHIVSAAPCEGIVVHCFS